MTYKHSNLNSKEMLWEILWHIPWDNEESDELLFKEIKSSNILRPEFVVVDDVTKSEVILMKEFDNPYHSIATLEAIELVEKALKRVPNTVDYEIDQQEIAWLLLYFNSIRASINWQVSVYTEKYKRYQDSSNYMFNVKTKEFVDQLQNEHNLITADLVKVLEENHSNKENEKNEKIKWFDERRKNKENELLSDENITSVELKRRMKEFDDEHYYELKEIDNKYKEKYKAKETEITSNRDVKYKLLSKSFAETLTTSSVEYWEMIRKTRIIQLVKEYFESRSQDLNWIIMTLNVIFKNTVNLTWDFWNNQRNNNN